MRQKLVLFASVLSLTLSVAREGFGQWVETNGQGGNDVFCFAQNAVGIFAGTTNGVVISTDSGTSWKATGLTQETVQFLVILGTNIFASTYDGIFLSTDNGASWLPTNGKSSQGSTIDSGPLAVCGGNIFVGTGSGIFRSSDSGANWNPVRFASLYISALAANDSNIFAAISDSIFLSTDNGVNWTEVDSGLISSSITALAVIDTIILAGTLEGTIYFSTNNGTSWTNAGSAGSDVHSVALIGTTILAGTTGGIFRSIPVDSTWIGFYSSFQDAVIDALCIVGNNILAANEGYAEFSGGIFRSNDSGITWTSINASIPPYDVDVLAVIGTKLFVSTIYDGVFLSTNNGTSWKTMGNMPINSLTIEGPNILALDGGVFRSTDGGDNWKEIGLDSINTTTLIIDGTNIFVGSYGKGIFLSTNNGTSWQSLDSGLQALNGGLENLEVYSFALNDTILFAGTNQGIFRLESDNSWTAINNGPTATLVNTLAALGTNLFAGTGNYYSGVDTGGAIFRSTDDGKNWEETSFNRAVVFTFVVSGSRIFAGTADGVYVSLDSGTTWFVDSSGLSESSISSLAVVDTNLFAGILSSGIWRRSISKLTGLIPVPEAAADTLPVLLSFGGSITDTISGDSAGYNAHRIDFLNNTISTIDINSAALTTTNNHFQINQLLPGTPDSEQHGGFFSTIILFTGDTLGTVYLDTIILTLNDSSYYYVYLIGNSFSQATFGVLQNSATSLSSFDFLSFPNPFPAKTTITISPTERCAGTITIVNLLGQQVANLFDGELTAGEHSFIWDASNAAPGCYWCIAHLGDQTERAALSVQR